MHHLRMLLLAISVPAIFAALFYSKTATTPRPGSSPEQIVLRDTITLNAPVKATALPSYFSHLNIATTVFWVGEGATAENDYIANSASAWDGNWKEHYGGYDNPDKRNGLLPAGFTPKENPFYFALPYNDTLNDKRKPTGINCKPTTTQDDTHSWCKNTWIMIRYGDKIAYAQWEDVGPNEEDDASYVFGTMPPRNTFGEKAGLDVSPAVRDYLGLGDTSFTDWTLVTADKVPSGPWKDIVTTSPGYSIQR